MKPFENEAELAAALSELRPTPEEEFAAELDAWADVGFPRRSRRRSAWGSLRERLTSTPPRRLLVPAGAFAVAAIVIATAVVATTDRQDPPASNNLLSLMNTTDGTGTETEPSDLSESVSKSAEAPAGASTAASATGYAPKGSASGPYAADTGPRDIERSADIVLGADPADVRADSAKVFDAVHAADGIVLSSSIRDGDAGEAGADFELLIPAAKVGDALAAFSGIAEVRSRHEATQDITAPTVRVGEKLQDSRAKIEGLLGQLASADTDEERAAVEAQLRSERYRAAAFRSRLSSLSRRANLSRVSLRIETGASSSSGEGGGWGVADGLDGAGRILAVAAGVTVIGLALFAPFALIALIALIAWLTRRAWIRQARTRALSRP
jgi:hypothetical protein